MAKKTKTTKGTKLTERELIVLSAIFARSNMGQGFPAKRDVERLKDYVPRNPAYDLTLGSCVNDICRKFMESDEHQGYFMEEAEDWLKDLRRDTCEGIAHVHPDIAELMWRDPATYVDDRRWPNG